ncbi:hypothetical protein [Novosphingobium sp. JCM 18896]|uniref:hypothetical protein n=1 Tax=Novosphingobium sp. JCM 18896 TaxID=2989731 RepID=UPI0022236403|nr:hypothetical protein [Novosphingobium sp. JCM 18896]MCW1428277.1 hypothetical protein [Novosphingobium sp. JCM 18896]
MKAATPFLAGLLILAAPALAAEPEVTPTASPTSASGAQPDAKPDDTADKLVCRRQVVVGSRLPGPKVCRTQAQWNSNNRDDQDAIRRAQDHRRSVDGG